MTDFESNLLLGSALLQVFTILTLYAFVVRVLWFASNSANPTAALLLAVVLLLFCGTGFVAAWFAGWWKARRLHIGGLMGGWTGITLAIVFQEALYDGMSPGQTATVMAIFTAGVMLTAIWILSIHTYYHERYRRIWADPSDANVDELIGLGPSVLPVVRELLEGEDRLVRVAAVKCLARLGPEAIQDLKLAVRDEDPEVAALARDALGLTREA